MEGPPGGFKASQNEKQGLLANGTWDETDIRPKSEILAMAAKRFTLVLLWLL